MANTLNPKNPVLLRSATRPVMETVRRLVETSQTWKAGQLLYQKNDGLVYTAASNATTIQFLAYADQTAIGNSTTYKRMGVLHEDDILEMFELDGTIAESNVGLKYALSVVSNICTLDIGDTDNDAFVVVAPTWREETFVNDSTDIKARTLVKVLPAVLEAEAAA